MALMYNLFKSIYDLNTLDVKSIYIDMTSIYNRYRIDMESMYDL